VRLQVSDPDEAIAELEREVGLTLRGFAEGTSSVPERLRIPIDKLKQFLKSSLNLQDKGNNNNNNK